MFLTKYKSLPPTFPPTCLCLTDSALQSIFLLRVHKWNPAADFYFCYSLTFWSLKCCRPKVSPSRQWKQLSSASAPMLIQPLLPGSRGAAAAVTHLFYWTFSRIYISLARLTWLRRPAELPVSQPRAVNGRAGAPGSGHPDNRCRLWLMNTVSAAQPFPSPMCGDSFSPLSPARPQVCVNGDLINNVCEGRSKEGLLRSLLHARRDI